MIRLVLVAKTCPRMGKELPPTDGTISEAGREGMILEKKRNVLKEIVRYFEPSAVPSTESGWKEGEKKMEESQRGGIARADHIGSREEWTGVR